MTVLEAPRVELRWRTVLFAELDDGAKRVERAHEPRHLPFPVDEDPMDVSLEHHLGHATASL